MKRRIIWLIGSLLALVVIVLGLAGNYIYDLAISRNSGVVQLYGGTDKAVEAVSALEEEQKRLEELRSWTSRQKFEQVSIQSEDGLTLKGLYLKNKYPNGKTVVLAHGYKGNSDQLPEVTRFYYRQGYNILKPDARGHGDSEGDYIGYGWPDRLDYVKWIDFLVKEKGEEAIFLHGFSMGASTVLMTSGEDLPPEVKGIISDSAYTNLEDELAHQLKYLYDLPAFPLVDATFIVTKIRAGYSFKEASAVKQVKKNDLPLLIIHGAEDELVPTEMATEIYKAAGGKKDMWIVPGAGHTEGFLVNETEYSTKVIDFVNEAMMEQEEKN
ncbi:alpha/beta hydrolase [Rossellomorea marisflavi]|uniref:alpha/beta hydrolase n=1 Tax=Rossellomorea marisflavi TaxID=189381 RepID=UPI00296E844D|nr:alpha/beta hydrolase [Rossellomorea marisflavi]MDW4525917.1 alpha/beta hydrolase [Rossellomorea marisflavi]